MAKAKKSESAAESTEEKKPAAKKAPAAEKKAPAADKEAPAAEKKPAGAEKKAAAPKAAAAKKAPATKAAAAPAQPAGVPLIDTNLAAQSAAKMLLNRAAAGDASTATPQAGKESTAFKNLKDQLANPKPSGLNHLFGPAGDAKKSGGSFLGQQRGGHNQTQGGFNKTGVPRRTNG